MAEPLTLAGETGNMAARPKHTAQPKPTAMFASATRIRDELIGFDDQRIFVFYRLDRQVGGVDQVNLNAILPSLTARPPKPPPTVSR